MVDFSLHKGKFLTTDEKSAIVARKLSGEDPIKLGDTLNGMPVEGICSIGSAKHIYAVTSDRAYIVDSTKLMVIFQDRV